MTLLQLIDLPDLSHLSDDELLSHLSSYIPDVMRVDHEMEKAIADQSARGIKRAYEKFTAAHTEKDKNQNKLSLLQTILRE